MRYEVNSQKEMVQMFKEKLGSNKAWALRALQVIYSNQTDDEQQDAVTKHYNKIGFTGSDAEFLTSLAKQYEYKGDLSDKQMAILYRKMPKYAGQLLKMSGLKKVNHGFEK
ncbi:MAG: hypothetical protein HUJ68_10940 [Clostridia bacterium]|nr:hypothetical protein [Clostridia bacterium]